MSDELAHADQRSGPAPGSEASELTQRTGYVLAALDTTAAARPVLETALRVGEMTKAEVKAVHVVDGATEHLETLVERAGVPLRLLTGPVEGTLLEAMEAPEVLATVVGARATPGGKRPVGRIARHLLERTSKPVVVVPPEALAPGTFLRLLVPLEGTESSSRPVLQALYPLLAVDVEIIVLHVFTDKTLPRMLDRPQRDLELLGREFLATHCPLATGIELRSGPVGARVSEVSRQHRADLVVLSWSQDSSAGRANVVREVLGTSVLPVLLLPVASASAASDVPRGLAAGEHPATPEPRKASAP